MAKREPFTHMVRSFFDCFTNPFPGETLKEQAVNAIEVVRCWWDPARSWGDDPLGDWHGRNS